MKLNIGCGPTWRTYSDFEGLDKVDFGQTYKADVEKGELRTLFAENSIDEIRAEHFLEHTVRHVDVVEDMVYILKPGGMLLIVVPGEKSPSHRAFGHYSFFDISTFETIVREWYNTPLEIVKIVENERGDIHARYQKKVL